MCMCSKREGERELANLMHANLMHARQRVELQRADEHMPVGISGESREP